MNMTSMKSMKRGEICGAHLDIHGPGVHARTERFRLVEQVRWLRLRLAHLQPAVPWRVRAKELAVLGDRRKGGARGALCSLSRAATRLAAPPAAAAAPPERAPRPLAAGVLRMCEGGGVVRCFLQVHLVRPQLTPDLLRPELGARTHR